MIQPKYNPQEALDRIKLMMKYDTSKTLNENKQIVFEQEIGTKTAIGTGAAAATGAAIAGGAAAANVATTTALGSAAYSAMGLGSALGAQSVTAAAALGGGVIAGAAALALTPLIVWYMDKDNAKTKVERIIKYCTTDKAKIDKIQRGASDGDVRNLSDQLYDAMKGAGTDEEKVYGAFKGLKTASDFCALVDRFNKDYGDEGDLLEWLDSDFDQTSEWMQIYRPLRDIVEDTLLSIKDPEVEKDCKENPDQEKCKVKKKTGGGEGYKDCSGTYTKGCKSSVIAKVQGCLGGLKQDGKFGPNTESKLKAKFPDLASGFKDSDVEKICGAAKEEKLTTDIEISDLGQGEQSDEKLTASVTSQETDPNSKTSIG